jgi:hypothetical protein
MTRLAWSRLGFLAGLGLLLLAAIGEALGWWRDLGLILGGVGLVATFWFGIDTASESTVTRLIEPIARIDDRLETIGIVLERIERLLTERLPPR